VGLAAAIPSTSSASSLTVDSADAAAQPKRRALVPAPPAPALVAARAPSSSTIAATASMPASPAHAVPLPFMACAPAYVRAGLTSAPRTPSIVTRTGAPPAVRQTPAPIAGSTPVPSAGLARSASASAMPTSAAAATQAALEAAAKAEAAAREATLSELEETCARLAAVQAENARLETRMRALQEKTTLQADVIDSFEAEVKVLECNLAETAKQATEHAAEKRQLSNSLDQCTQDLAAVEDELVIVRTALRDALEENEQVRWGPSTGYAGFRSRSNNEVRLVWEGSM